MVNRTSWSLFAAAALSMAAGCGPTVNDGHCIYNRGDAGCDSQQQCMAVVGGGLIEDAANGCVDQADAAMLSADGHVHVQHGLPRSLLALPPDLLGSDTVQGVLARVVEAGGLDTVCSVDEGVPAAFRSSDAVAEVIWIRARLDQQRGQRKADVFLATLSRFDMFGIEAFNAEVLAWGEACAQMIDPEGGSTSDSNGTASAEGFSSSTSGSETTTGPTIGCGNGQLEPDEQCDGNNWGGATCESLGASPGRLNCTAECLIDLSECVPDGMVLVPAGSFEMGDKSSVGLENSRPVRHIQMPSYWIDEFEVTVEAYSSCVAAGGCTAPTPTSGCNWMVPGRADHPMNCVSWPEAEDYCAWVEEGSKRLPTEAEWEKAARGSDGHDFPWGNSPPPSCTHAIMQASGVDGCGTGTTLPVGSRPAGVSPYGAHDMAGNVWEWVADRYATPYDARKTNNPSGPSTGMSRAMRGGGFDAMSAASAHTAYRIGIDQRLDLASDEAGPLAGFRCAQSIPEYDR